MLGFDDLVAKTWTIGNEDFEFLLLLLLLLVEHSVVGVQTSLSLCLTSLRCHSHPFQLSFECLATFGSSLLFLSHTLGLLVEPAGVISLPRNAFATIEFENPF